ncbi:MAG: DUF1007 family protein [Elusimicrobia bacterium]|nr:DUF1007 family protein [Elusimicrobiota bacterium]
MNKFLRVLFLVFCVLSADVYAHPHIFMDCGAAFVFGADGLEGIRLKWAFDEFYSETIMLDFDGNKNGFLEEKEVRKVEKESFSNLKNFHYFTCLSSDGKNFEVKQVSDFSAVFSSGTVTFEFFIPFKVTSSGKYKEVVVAVYDGTYYTDVAFLAKDPVVFEKAGGVVCEYAIEADKKFAYYFGEIIPKVIKMKFRKRV